MVADSETDQPGPLVGFRFTTELAADTRKDLDMQLNAIDIRMQRLSEKSAIGGMAILEMILQTGADESDLRILAKALGQASKLLKTRSDLRSKLSVLDLAESQPDWFASTFGDFEDMFDGIQSSHFEESDSSGDTDGTN